MELLEQIFKYLAKKWKEETINLSSMQEITSNEAYLSIIGLGPAVIPMILVALRSESDFWFCALRILTKTNPVSQEMSGDIDVMAKVWLDWGHENGYI